MLKSNKAFELLLSELELHVSCVAEFGQVLLHHGFEGRWAAVENQGVGTWLWHVLFDHLFGDEADTLLPV